MVIHAQVVACPLNLSQVNFNCLQNVIAKFLNFNVYNLESKDWEKFQREWRQSANFFISREPKIKEANFEESDVPKGVPKERLQPGVPTEPID
ncbi:hypothetical protein J1N35_002050 [Gossypium stocksii]|uniref:Uncharacterized protein n=1 Tax=Gossypium stocksii TaxID=47602 RepID=A0A9D3WKA3_9ROSI|nr:hypothetical protein J1N35_002050 [Gossypium stocksii]